MDCRPKDRCFHGHLEQVGQGVFKNNALQGLFHQFHAVPLAEPEHDLRYIRDRTAVYQSQTEREQGASVCPRAEDRQPLWQGSGIHIPWGGKLCEPSGKPSHEHHLEAGPCHPGTVPCKDQQDDPGLDE